MLHCEKNLDTRVLENIMKKEACTKRKVVVTEKNLPLCCPMPDEKLFDAHPRVYLAIEKSGREVCPYCETEYELHVK